MKILGVGLSRTATLSLCQALNLLGLNAISWAPERLRDVMDGSNNYPDFRRYDDVDAVTDLPAALFFHELLDAYPGCKLILTVRDVEDWFRSVKYHYDTRIPANLEGDPAALKEARITQTFAYGSAEVNEFLYKKRFLDHNQSILDAYPDTLVMNIPDGDGWDILCSYLGMPVPNIQFPRVNMTQRTHSMEP